MENCRHRLQFNLFQGHSGLHVGHIFEKVGKVKIVLALERQHHFQGFRRRVQLQPDQKMASKNM